MTATTTVLDIEAAIERVYHVAPPNFTAPRVAIEDALGMWWWDSIRVVFDRWDCDNDDCPGRPAWDDTLGDESQDALHAARDEALALFRGRMADSCRRC